MAKLLREKIMNYRISLIALFLVAMPGCCCKNDKESKVQPQLFDRRDPNTGERVGSITGRRKLIQDRGYRNNTDNTDYPDCDYADPLSTPADCPPDLVQKAKRHKKGDARRRGLDLKARSQGANRR